MDWPLALPPHETSSTPSEPISQPSASEHKCSVCLELFTEPKVLPCCHTFCLECIKKTATSEKTKGQVTCPQCRQSHQIPAGGLPEFLTDFIANYEVEVAGFASRKSDKVTFCGECEQAVPVSHFCSDCQNYLCDECGVQLHKRLKTFRGHRVVPVSEVNAATLQSCQVHYCALHKGEILKLYCETCNKLVCRDCTLVEHRQHSYKFLEDARKQLEAEMTTLKTDVEKKLSTLKLDFREIKKIEVAATGHSQVVKADINLYFDSLVRSIEGRRSALLKEAEEACQKDLKQVWADKEFHELTIGHVTAVFKLVEKARKCTSDSEMILTSLQSISQLKKMKEKEWDSREFVRMVSSAPGFKKKKASMDSFGAVIRVSSPSKEMEILVPHQSPNLGSCFEVAVVCSPIESLLDTRSGENVNLRRGVMFPELEAVVQYGKAKKELSSSLLAINNISEQQQRVLQQKTLSMQALSKLSQKNVETPVTHYGGKRVVKKVKERVHSHASTGGVIVRTAVASKSEIETNSQIYEVSIQLVCGGTHIAIFRYGNWEATHTFTVQGQPCNGHRVRKGPDWSGRQSSVMGSLYSYNDDDRMGQQNGMGTVNYYNYNQVQDGTMVRVVYDTGGDFDYKWGKDEEYEIELCL